MLVWLRNETVNPRPCSWATDMMGRVACGRTSVGPMPGEMPRVYAVTIDLSASSIRNWPCSICVRCLLFVAMLIPAPESIMAPSGVVFKELAFSWICRFFIEYTPYNKGAFTSLFVFFLFFFLLFLFFSLVSTCMSEPSFCELLCESLTCQWRLQAAVLCPLCGRPAALQLSQ